MSNTIFNINSDIKASGLIVDTISSTNISVNDTSAPSFTLSLASTSVPALTANRTLTFDVSNANRTIDLNGDVSLASSFTTSGANALTLTTTGMTNVTLPTTGTLITSSNAVLDDTASAFNLVLASTSAPVLSADRTLTFDVSNANRTIDLNGNVSLASSFTTAGANALTLTTTGMTNVTLPTSGTLMATPGAATWAMTMQSTGTTTYTVLTTAHYYTVIGGMVICEVNMSYTQVAGTPGNVSFSLPVPIVIDVNYRSGGVVSWHNCLTFASGYLACYLIGNDNSVYITNVISGSTSILQDTAFAGAGTIVFSFKYVRN